jgi:hypothetical protein
VVAGEEGGGKEGRKARVVEERGKGQRSYGEEGREEGEV